MQIKHPRRAADVNQLHTLFQSFVFVSALCGARTHFLVFWLCCSKRKSFLCLFACTSWGQKAVCMSFLSCCIWQVLISAFQFFSYDNPQSSKRKLTFQHFTLTKQQTAAIFFLTIWARTLWNCSDLYPAQKHKGNTNQNNVTARYFPENIKTGKQVHTEHLTNKTESGDAVENVTLPANIIQHDQCGRWSVMF